jgi:hypothetical protein
MTLWLPSTTRAYQYRAERFQRFEDGWVAVFRYMPEVRSPDDPTWSADPLGNQTWRLYYHGLSWLLCLAWGVDHGAHPEATRQRMAQIVIGYIEANVFVEPADAMAWDDHAAADRLAMLAFLWSSYFSSNACGIDPNRYRAAVAVHVARLIGFYQSRRWIDSNHGLFHALALLSAVLVFADADWAGEAARIGPTYLQEVVSTMVHPVEGVSTEQSLGYHQIALQLLREVQPFLREHYPSLLACVDGLAARMVDFNLLIRGDDDAMPAIGDTRLFARIPKPCLGPSGDEPDTDYHVFIESRGARGRPLPSLAVFEGCGYAIFRRREIFEGPVTRAVLTFHPARIAHGHFDTLALTLCLRGTDVLIDSGGPYAYGNPLRFSYFMAARAHNLLVVDGENHRAPGRLVDFGTHGDVDWVRVEHSGHAGRVVSRTAMMVSDEALVVFDRVTPKGKESRLELFWHYPPSASIRADASDRSAKAVIDLDGVRVQAISHSNVPLRGEVVQGRLEPEHQD